MFSDRDKAIKLIQNGLYEGANPHKAFIILAKFYKYINLNKEKTKELVINWLEKQSCKDMFDDVMVDMNTVINDVYDNDYKFIDNIEIPITLSEMVAINELKTKGEKKVAFVMLFLSKIFKDEHQIFYCTGRFIGHLTKMSRVQCDTVINKLIECNFIECVSRNVIKKAIKNSGEHGVVYKHPNRYKIIIEPCEDVVYTIINPKDMMCEFVLIYKHCIEKRGFKVNRRFKTYLYTK